MTDFSSIKRVTSTTSNVKATGRQLPVKVKHYVVTHEFRNGPLVMTSYSNSAKHKQKGRLHKRDSSWIPAQRLYSKQGSPRPTLFADLVSRKYRKITDGRKGQVRCFYAPMRYRDPHSCLPNRISTDVDRSGCCGGAGRHKTGPTSEKPAFWNDREMTGRRHPSCTGLSGL